MKTLSNLPCASFLPISLLEGPFQRCGCSPSSISHDPSFDGQKDQYQLKSQVKSLLLRDIVSLTPLCPRCQSFDIQTFTEGSYKYRGYLFSDVIDAALQSQSCSFCSLLLEHMLLANEFVKNDILSDYVRLAVQKRAGDSIFKRLPRTFSQLNRRYIEAWMRGPLWVHFWVSRSAGESLDAMRITKLHACVSTSAFGGLEILGAEFLNCSFFPRPTRTINFNVAADVGSPANISQDITGHVISQTYSWSWDYLGSIKSWHAKCLKDHPECRKTLSGCQDIDPENAPLPRRCIEVQWVSNTNLPGPGSPKFILRETEGQTGKYIALSHRWLDGITELSNTLKANYKCRTGQCDQHPPDDCNIGTAAPYTDLFAHACTLSFHLGVKYIWIDSVCIIQDDEADWKREAMKMADYYQFAWLTIAAADVDGNALFGRTIEVNDIPRVARLPYRDKSGEQKGHFYLQCAGLTTLAEEYDKNVSNSFLLRRGWVYQEWMLSRRLLAFSRSSSGVFIHCQSSAPEVPNGDRVLKRFSPQTDEPAVLVQKAFKHDLELSFDTFDEVISSWITVVEGYAGLEISFIEQDRLVALAGIAREFGAALEPMLRERRQQQTAASRQVSTITDEVFGQPYSYEYACGYWTGPVSPLLWEQSQQGLRVRVAGIPTWSWASMGEYMVDDQGNKIVNNKGFELKQGMRVQWDDENSNTTDLCSVAQKVVFVPVDPKTWNPLFERILPQDPGANPDIKHSNDSRFAILPIRGFLMPVQISRHFTNEGDTDTAALLTDHNLDFGRDMWRGVAAEADPGVITGWASIEHPDFQEDEVFEGGGTETIYALFMTQISNIMHRGGFGFANWSNMHTAFQVLYLRARTDVGGRDNCYERLGVGRLFGNKVEEVLRRLEKSTVHLV
ncbi:heterokaryon incompatibility protein-domain-containing protein [Triangularia verruculosa]|uniref:Heterokaryon incompatibility protein-domain-containing protein n=1 Tax=Triangularia verruculosa TaxID=2587418 RepID=A0AAN6XRL2_9PEZI|nr:heterokaryon incompatibility protein-domain-containing protein [Triangularia verruculosa]